LLSDAEMIVFNNPGDGMRRASRDVLYRVFKQYVDLGGLGGLAESLLGKTEDVVKLQAFRRPAIYDADGGDPGAGAGAGADEAKVAKAQAAVALYAHVFRQRTVIMSTNHCETSRQADVPHGADLLVNFSKMSEGVGWSFQGPDGGRDGGGGGEGGGGAHDVELVWRDGCGPAADDDPDGQPPMPNSVEEANAHQLARELELTDLVTDVAADDEDGELKAAEAVRMEAEALVGGDGGAFDA
jgi:hypothetical protein